MKTHTLAMAIMTAAAAAMLPLSITGQTPVSPAAGPTITPAEAERQDGFISRNGQTYIVRNGIATPLDREMTLRITPQGITGFDDIRRVLTPDAMLTLDGRIITAPTDIVIAPPSPAATTEPATDPERPLDRGVTGQNTSGLAPARPATREADVAPSGATRPAGIIRSETDTRIRVRDPAPAPTTNPNATSTQDAGDRTGTGGTSTIRGTGGVSTSGGGVSTGGGAGGAAP